MTMDVLDEGPNKMQGKVVLRNPIRKSVVWLPSNPNQMRLGENINFLFHARRDISALIIYDLYSFTMNICSPRPMFAISNAIP
jgi:hypothetical protein